MRMPQPFKNAVITSAGALLLTRAQAGEIKIEFTRIAVGDGEYTEGEKTFSALQKREELKSIRNSYDLSGIEVYSAHSVKVTALITNQDAATGGCLVNEGYFINEMGLYAKVKDGGDVTEVLYSSFRNTMRQSAILQRSRYRRPVHLCLHRILKHLKSR